MARYIDADKLKPDTTVFLSLYAEEPVKVFSQKRIDNAPTVDAVPLVRCKDCKYLEITGCYGECGKAILGIVNPDDFCSRGERRADNAR